MIILEPLPARQFNDIPLIHEQPSVSENHLLAIGSIFVRHQMQFAYAIGIFHRHIEMPENGVLVHSSSPADTNVCRISSYPNSSNDESLLRAHSLFVTRDGDFQAYEYERSAHDVPEKFPPPDDFVHEFRDYLRAEKLDTVLCLVKEGSAASPSITAYMCPDKRGMISIPQRGAPIEDLQSASICGWSFAGSNNEDVVTCAKYKCRDDHTDLYRRTEEA